MKDSYTIDSQKIPWLSFAFILISIGRLYSKNTISNPLFKHIDEYPVIKLYQSGQSIPKVAQKLNLTKARVSAILTKHKIPRRDVNYDEIILAHELFADGYSIKEIASEVLMSIDWVAKTLKQPKPKTEKPPKIERRELQSVGVEKYATDDYSLTIDIPDVDDDHDEDYWGALEEPIPRKKKNPLTRKRKINREEFIADVQAGLSDKELADKYATTIATVRVYRGKYTSVKREKGQPIKINVPEFKKDVEAGMSDADLIAKYNSTLNTVRVYRAKFTSIKRPKGQKTKIHKDQFIADVKAGMTDGQLAVKYNSTPVTMRVYRSRYAPSYKRPKIYKPKVVRPKIIKTKTEVPTKKQSEREAYRIWKKYERDRGDFE